MSHNRLTQARSQKECSYPICSLVKNLEKGERPLRDVEPLPTLGRILQLPRKELPPSSIFDVRPRKNTQLIKKITSTNSS